MALKIAVRACDVAALVGLHRYRPRAQALDDLWAVVDPVAYREHTAMNTVRPTEAEVALIRDSTTVPAPGISPVDHATRIVSTAAELGLGPETMDALRSNVYTTHGTATEAKAVDAVIDQIPGVRRCDTCYRKDYGDFVLVGRVDARSDDRVFEIKNRVRRLFGQVPVYEYTQVQAYLDLLDLDTGVLVEAHGDDVMHHTVTRNRDFWEGCVTGLLRAVQEVRDRAGPGVKVN